MEGLLWKWTNYWSGWQPRWFILDDGILSYYNSQDEVGKGCKGSVKMSVCDVMVDHADGTRLELCIQGEQRFYLKAANSKERQQWLVALGSCKASLQTMSDPSLYLSSSDYSRIHNGINQKKSELRIYCDLLMQQVHTIREVTNSEPTNAQKIEECSALLSETCNTFIHTLEGCMKLIDRPNKPLTPTKDVIPVLNPSSPVNPGMKHISRSPSTERPAVKSILRKPQRSVSQSSTDTDMDSPAVHRQPKTHTGTPVNSTPTTPTTTPTATPTVSGSGLSLSVAADSQASTVIVSNGGDASPHIYDNSTQIDGHVPDILKSELNGSVPEPAPVISTYFTNMGSSFVSMVDSIGDGIHTKTFLSCASAIANVFDNLSSTAFAPVKNDLLGNVKKIEQKWTTDPNKLNTLQKLVDYEIKNKQHLDPNSATQALLWLTRGLTFLAAIFQEIPKNSSLVGAVSTAYERTLKPYHNFVVRGVVSIAVRALPYKRDFLLSLIDDTPEDMPEDLAVESLVDHMHKYQRALQVVCSPLMTFYKERNMVIIQES